MAFIRVEMNHSGARQILRSTAVRENIGERAERVAGAAGPGFEAQVIMGRNRALAYVSSTTDEAARAEAEDRALTRAMDAAR